MQRMLALVLSLSVGACSFVMTKGPGDVGNPPTVVADCTESKAGPVIDTIAASVLVVTALGGVGVLQGNSSTSEDNRLGETATIAAGVAAIGFGVGAFYGFYRVSQCKRSHAAYALEHPAPVVQQMAYYPPPGAAPIGSSGGFCTPQNTCEAGLVCAGMPDHTNKCMPGQPQPPLIEVGTQDGACTAQLTCNGGLVCAGMPDRTNKCMPEPAPGTHGGSCMANNACNAGLQCAGMPDRTNKCMPSR